jgi:hypothetical protein
VRLDRQLRGDGKQQDRTVGRCILHGACADTPRGTGFVLDDDRAAQIALQAIRDEPCDRIGRAAGGKRIDDLEGLFLRAARCRECDQRACTEKGCTA